MAHTTRETTYVLFDRVHSFKNPFARIFGYLSLIPVAIIEDQSMKDAPENKLF